MQWQTKLLRWYRKHKRDLPWRRRPTPYRVWISEIMLQQTTVKTVIPYYRRFLKLFPSLKALAQAPEDAVLAAWSGLGYYSRARNLHKAAQICAQNHRGRLPRDIRTLKSLPGIGDYSAGAIASIAFDQRAALVDGNVARVLCRLNRLVIDPKSNPGHKKLWQVADKSLPRQHCGDFNQALMELGATLCSPTRPTCTVCPIQSDCRAYQKDEPGNYPQTTRKASYRNVHWTSALLQQRDAILMTRRPARGFLRDMWEFPTVEGDFDDLTRTFQLKCDGAKALPPIRHSIMDRRITVTPWIFVKNPLRHLPESRWVGMEEVQKLPTSSLVGKILQDLRNFS